MDKNALFLLFATAFVSTANGEHLFHTNAHHKFTLSLIGFRQVSQHVGEAEGLQIRQQGGLEGWLPRDLPAG